MNGRTMLEVYSTRRMASLAALGFAAGVPLMLTSRTMKVWARDTGVDLTTVGLFSLVTLPYAYKFVWAPVLDRVSPPMLDRRRGWLLLAQVLLVLGIAGMGLSGPRSAEDSLILFGTLAAVVAFLSATQDIAADAYRTDVLHPRELGAGASVYIGGYRVAMLCTGAGAVALAAVLPWPGVYFAAAGAMLVGIIATVLAPRPPVAAAPRSFAAAVLEPAREFIGRTRWRAGLILLFIVLFKLPDYMAGAMTDVLLLDLGFTKAEIAFWGLGVGTAVTIPGVLIGGPIVTKVGLGRALVVFGLAQAISNAGYLVMAAAGRHHQLMVAVIGIEYFCTGLVAAGFVAFLMSQCDRRFSATQFALLSSLMGASAALGGAPTGALVEALGYMGFFTITILVGIPGLALLPLCPARKSCTRVSESVLVQV
jgi:PAT family beta-lactamase induction signal transducer AmpG